MIDSCTTNICMAHHSLLSVWWRDARCPDMRMTSRGLLPPWAYSGTIDRNSSPVLEMLGRVKTRFEACIVRWHPLWTTVESLHRQPYNRPKSMSFQILSSEYPITVGVERKKGEMNPVSACVCRHTAQGRRSPAQNNHWEQPAGWSQSSYRPELTHWIPDPSKKCLTRATPFSSMERLL